MLGLAQVGRCGAAGALERVRRRGYPDYPMHVALTNPEHAEQLALLRVAAAAARSTPPRTRRRR